jgi:hypothetical protein
LRAGADWRFRPFIGGVAANARTASSNDIGCREIGCGRSDDRADSPSASVAVTVRRFVSAVDDRSSCAAISPRATSAGRLRFGVLRGRDMADTPEFIDLTNRLRALLASEYQRGQDDATRRIIEAAQGKVSPSSTREQPPRMAGSNGAQRPSGRSKRRAPAGAPDALVTRVLRERGSNGASSMEIEEAAHSELEKMVSQSGIRFALDRGRSAGWFLVETRD